MDIQAGLRRPKIDMHCHAWPFENVDEEAISTDQLVVAGEMLGITEFWCSSPYIGAGFPTIEQVRHENDAVLRAMKRHPKRIRGMCYVLGGHYKAALDEVDRCLDEGMVGIKLYFQYKLSDPAVWPVIEHAIDRRMPILVHAGYLRDADDLSRQPRISNGEDFAIASREYPEATLIHAHIGGGGDWEWTVRAMQDTSPNLYVDVSGSNLDDGQVEFAVAEMGVERVLFGTDGTMTGSVGKVLDADLTDGERESIFWTNAERILAHAGKEPTEPRQEGARS